MRHLCVLTIVAVALVSCGGGGSSSSQGMPAAPASTLTVPQSNGAWSASLGPWNAQNSGKLNAFAIDPHDASTIYAGGGIGTVDGVTSDTGIYKTVNGGASWSAQNNGLLDTTINWLLFDPQGALYAATEKGGIFRSSDGAASWQQVSNEPAVRQIVEANGILYAVGKDGVLTSTNGITWSLAIPTPSQANTIAIRENDVYAGLADGSLLHAQGTASATMLYRFGALGAPPVVHAIAIDPADASSIYVSFAAMIDGIYTDALMHSFDAGRTWSPLSVPASLRGAQAIAFSRATPHRLYVAGTGLGYTDDARAVTAAQGYGDARTLQVLDGDRLVIGSDQGIGVGAYGASFRSLTAGLPVNIVRSVAVHGSTVLVTMQDFAPARSTDGGITWQTLSIGSQENGVAYINPSSPSICYVLDHGINVSTDGCSTFSSEAIGQRLASTQPFATDPASARTYAITANGLYVAADGVHFLPIACSVPNPVDIAVDPHDGRRIFISSATGGVAVWHSNDGGITFSRSTTFVPPGPSYPNDAPVLAVDPSNGAVVALTETAIYRSTDGGATFVPLQQLALQERRRDPDARTRESETAGYNIGEHIQFIGTTAGPMLLMSTAAGIVSSFDDGSSTHPIGSNAISHQFEGIATDGNGRVCAGTDGEGVLCSDASTLASLR